MRFAYTYITTGTNRYQPSLSMRVSRTKGLCIAKIEQLRLNCAKDRNSSILCKKNMKFSHCEDVFDETLAT